MKNILLLLLLQMALISNSSGQVKVIAHRGAWKNTGAPENSIASLKNAIKLGCAGSEFDVHMSSDSVLFIHHDHGIQGLDIEKTTAKQLLELKLSNGETMPTLEEYLLAGIKQKKTRLILEIKPSEINKERSIALTHRVVETVKLLKAEAVVDYISFDYDVCKEVLRLAPKAKVAYLNGDLAPEALTADHMDGLDYHFKVLQKNTDWIKEAKERKLTINSWTVNDEAVMDWMISQNVDFITTNEPELLLKKLGK